MPAYMLIIKDGDEISTMFFDDYTKADNARMNAECGCGLYTELYNYTRFDENDEMEPLSYLQIA